MTTRIASAAQLAPMGDRIVVRPKQQEETTKSGIVLPETAKERPQEGEVVAVGPGRYLKSGERLKMELKVGDKIIYSKYAGTELQTDDEELLVLGSSDVLARMS